MHLQRWRPTAYWAVLLKLQPASQRTWLFLTMRHLSASICSNVQFWTSQQGANKTVEVLEFTVQRGGWASLFRLSGHSPKLKLNCVEWGVTQEHPLQVGLCYCYVSRKELKNIVAYSRLKTIVHSESAQTMTCTVPCFPCFKYGQLGSSALFSTSVHAAPITNIF